jgi:hypothetical protein
MNKEYKATNLGGTLWMVRHYIKPAGPDDESDYVETEISVDTTDPQAAIDAAIQRGSWA